MGSLSKAMENTWIRIVTGLGFLGFIARVHDRFGLAITDTLLLMLVILVGVMLLYLIIMAKGIESLDEKIQGVCRYNALATNGGKRKEDDEEVKTSGAGAFAGMIVGGALGLPFGPAGVIIGGVIGALFGDQIERENEEERRRKRR